MALVPVDQDGYFGGNGPVPVPPFFWGSRNVGEQAYFVGEQWVTYTTIMSYKHANPGENVTLRDLQITFLLT